MPNLPIILLAAGESTRMGYPKPLLPWKGKTLIESQINCLKNTHQPIVVVLGAYSDEIIPFINTSEVIISINEAWKEGMGTSIASGVEKALSSIENLDGIIIAAIDQPLVDDAHLAKIISEFNLNEKQIIVSESDKGWRGVPVLFDRCYLEELTKLQGDFGAKSIVNKYDEHVLAVNGDGKLVDMDTPEIYKQLKNFTRQ